MSTPIPGVTYARTHGDPLRWRAFGRADLSLGRDSLIPGSYIPGPSTTGVLPGVALTPREANASGYCTLSTANEVIENVEFWGTVQATAPGIVLKNCAIRGRNPNLITSVATECVRSYGANNYRMTLIDCTIDPAAWLDERDIPIKATLGVHGGNIELYRCNITNVEDAVSHLGHSVMGGEASTSTHRTIVEQCWLHGMFFDNGDHIARSDKRLHSDVFQIQTGKNITVRYNMLGGARDMAGYRTWPNGYNSGDDGWNAAFQIAQAVSTDPAAQIENVLIEGNWIAGGTSGINHGYQAVRPNAFASTIIRNNRFFTRGTGWGTSANGPGTYDSGNGYYIIRSASLASTYSGNVIHETGNPVPITNG